MAAKVNDTVIDLRDVPADGTEAELVSIDSKEALHVLRHTATHIMAEAVKHIFPDAKVTIGPATETGFFYDFECPPFTKENLEAIEDDGDIYESIEEIWPDYPSKEDFFFDEEEY